MNRREFLNVLAAASACGLDWRHANAAQAERQLYDLPPFGQVSLLHFTDCHAQLLPSYYREPSMNLGVGEARGPPPQLVGEALLKRFQLAADGAQAHAFTHLDFERAARRYGKVGGFAHLATLIARLKASRPGALLLDGGDTWQGSGVSLWTQGRDMIEAAKLLGVDIMTGHWEFTYGAARVQEALAKELAGRIEFLAQNVKTLDFGDPVFPGSVLRQVNGVSLGIVGQAFPYTPIANPRHLIPDWTFGINEDDLQAAVKALRGKGAAAVVLLSHNGLDVDMKLASRVRGIDAILGGHTHDGVPQAMIVANPGGKTVVTNAGSNGKFLGVLDLEVKGGAVGDFRYRLLPVFSDLLPPDPAMATLIEKTRAPHRAKLDETLARSEGLLYRRGNFNGSWDQLILDALMAEKDAPIAFSPGFRWGTTLLPGSTITMDDLLTQTAITYPHTTVTEMSGAMIKTILEDVADNLFNPDPYYQQGGDMVRVGGLKYRCHPYAPMGKRISDMQLAGKAIEADKSYRVAGWAPVAPGARGEPIWELVARWLRAQKTITPRRPNVPELSGVAGEAGLAG